MDVVVKQEINNFDGTVQEKIKSYVSRIETLEQQKNEISEDIKDIYTEIKSFGLEPKIIRKIISMRKKSKEQLYEERELLELYMSALGMEI